MLFFAGGGGGGGKRENYFGLILKKKATEECFNVAMVLTRIVQYSIIVHAVPYGVLLISPLAYTVRTYDLTAMQP